MLIFNDVFQKKCIGIVILFFCAISLYAQNAKLHLKAGEQFLLNGMYDAAYDEFQKALAIDPNDGKAYFDIASVLQAKNDFAGAGQNYQKAAVMGNNPDENYLNAAKCFYQAKQDSSALKAIGAGLNIKAKNIDLLVLKARINFEQGNYAASLSAANEALKVKDIAIAYYYSGASLYRSGDIDQAQKALQQSLSRDKNLAGSHIEMAKIQIEKGEFDYAVDNCSSVLLLLDPNNVEALKVRSRAFHGLHEPEQSIDDITKAISLDKNNVNLYLQRANYNLDFAYFSNAVDDYTVSLGMNDSLVDAYLGRAKAYEALDKKADAKKDYQTLLAFLKSENKNPGLQQIAEKKIFDLGRENIKPGIVISQPLLTDKSELRVKETDSLITVKGTIKEQSGLKEALVNGEKIKVRKLPGGDYGFQTKLKTNNLDFITFTALDSYDNNTTISYPVVYVETDPPKVSLLSPAPEGNNIIHLESGDNTLYVEGKIEDASTISSVKVDEMNASFAPGDYNPRFSATIDIKNRKGFTVTATDKFGNKTRQTYEFARDGYLLSGNNPMGKTWVVIIENTDYKEFATLKNPENDVAQLKDALSRYKISKVLDMKNLTKREMERFFAIDLRDLIVSNNVKSLMIWYVGHGQYKNNTGYWIPIDGRYNDEYSNYNINALKASLYSYSTLTHILVVSDACAAGESFSIAMRGDNSLANCNDLNLIKQKSALVLTSSDSEPALDNSLFTKTFVNSLENNPADCIPVDAIAERVSLVMQKHSSQKPVFGRISGLESNNGNGTFFFIRR